jgi:tRNA pseudouridine38-40 synthase
MFAYKLILAYDGTHYSGWQIQKNAPTVQQQIELTLQSILNGKSVAITGSGRTDSGVHAFAQVAHFKIENFFEPKLLQTALNGLLPPDIRIRSVELVPLHFHAQYDAIEKEYHYHIYLDKVMNPFNRLYCWHIRYPLDIPLLQKAAFSFIGTHDFTSFANEAHAGSAARNPVRTLYRLNVHKVEHGLRIEFEGNGFLYKMVRNIVGMLVEVALHRYTIADIPRIFEARDRKCAAHAAPAQGLFLMRVGYGAF